MTTADKKHAIMSAFTAWPDKSATTIFEPVGCNQDYVSELRRQVKGSINLPSRVIGKDGNNCPAGLSGWKREFSFSTSVTSNLESAGSRKFVVDLPANQLG